MLEEAGVPNGKQSEQGTQLSGPQPLHSCTHLANLSEVTIKRGQLSLLHKDCCDAVLLSAEPTGVPPGELTAAEQQLEEETRQEGAVRWREYRFYAAAVGPALVSVIIISLLLMQVRLI